MARKSGTIVLITIFMRKKAGNFISSLALIQNSHCNLEKTNLKNNENNTKQWLENNSELSAYVFSFFFN